LQKITLPLINSETLKWISALTLELAKVQVDLITDKHVDFSGTSALLDDF